MTIPVVKNIDNSLQAVLVESPPPNLLAIIIGIGAKKKKIKTKNGQYVLKKKKKKTSVAKY